MENKTEEKNKENEKTDKREVKDLILSLVNFETVGKKVLSLGLKDTHINEWLKFGYVEGWTVKEIREYTIKILDTLDSIQDYDEIKRVLELKSICPYCFNLDFDVWEEDNINVLTVTCLNCGEDL